jgi:small-conductance mechanosensitive channel
LPSVLATPGTQRRASRHHPLEEAFMNGVIYLIGLIVVIMFILSFLGLR